MAYTLDEFAADCRRILKALQNTDSIEIIKEVTPTANTIGTAVAGKNHSEYPTPTMQPAINAEARKRCKYLEPLPDRDCKTWSLALRNELVRDAVAGSERINSTTLSC